MQAEIHCTKGGYIRAWAHKLGQDLGVGGVVEKLRRLKSAPYSVESALTLAQVEEVSSKHQEELEWIQAMGSSFIAIDHCLQDWKAITVTGKDEKLISNGQIPKELNRRLIYEQKTATQLQRVVGIRVMSGAGRLMSLLEAIPNKGLKIRRSFNLPL